MLNKKNKDLLYLISSEFSAKLGNMLILWLLSFKYGLETQGEWSLFMLLSTLFLRISSLNLGYGVRIEISNNPRIQPWKYLTCISYTQYVFIFFLATIYMVFERYFPYPHFRTLILFLFVEILANNLNQVLQSYHQFKEISNINALRLVFRVILAFGFVLIDISITNIFYFYSLIEVVVILYFLAKLFSLKEIFKLKVSGSHSDIISNIWFKSRSGYFSSLATFSLTKSDSLWIQYFFGSSELGMYALSKSIVNIMGLIGTPLSNLAIVKNSKDVEKFHLDKSKGAILLIIGLVLAVYLDDSSLKIGKVSLSYTITILLGLAQIFNTTADFDLNVIVRKTSKWNTFYLKVVIASAVSFLLILLLIYKQEIVIIPLLFLVGSLIYFIIVQKKREKLF